jgi:hypothetical protein
LLKIKQLFKNKLTCEEKYWEDQQWNLEKRLRKKKEIIRKKKRVKKAVEITCLQEALIYLV